MAIPEGAVEEIAFAGMADHEGEEENNGEDFDWDDQVMQYWRHLHSRRANRNVDPVHEAQCLAWNNWYIQFHHTLHDHDMNDTNAELWTFMTQMEWNFLAPREPD